MSVPHTFRKIIVVILLVFLGGTIHAQKRLEKKRLEKKAHKKYIKYSYLEAREIYLKLIEKGQASAEIYSNLGDSYYYDGMYTEAAEIYYKSFEDYPHEISPGHLIRAAKSFDIIGEFRTGEELRAKYAEYSGDTRLLNFQANYVEYDINNPRNFIQPWPLPQPTAKIVLNKENFKDCNNLDCVNLVLQYRLDDRGYEMSYYYVPFESTIDTLTPQRNHGFVLATKLEHIDRAGRPKKPNRWITRLQDRELGFSQWIKEIFVSEPGYFRVILFVVTDLENITENDNLSKERAQEMVSDGAASLFNELADSDYDDDRFKVTALIYQYKVEANSTDKVVPMKYSKVSARKHLLNSSIIFKL